MNNLCPDMTSTFARTRRAGFTLVEMLTVVGIITLLVALVTPTLMDVIRSTRLNSTGDSLVARLSLAQQSAISLSDEVEIRFYQYINADSERPQERLFYAYQVIHTAKNGVERALSDVYYLETGIILSDQANLSPLLTTTRNQVPATVGGRFHFTPPGNVAPEEVNVAAMRFYPDGSFRVLTTADSDNDALSTAIAYTIPDYGQSFMTLVEARDAQSTQPINFYCIQIDSYTGKSRVYRP
jgi:uncharacterized protein (TIGR02596 family)